MVAIGAGNPDQTWSVCVRSAKLAVRPLPDQPFVPVELLEELDALRGVNLIARKSRVSRL